MLFVEILGGVSGAGGCGSETVIMLCKKWHLVPVFFLQLFLRVGYFYRIRNFECVFFFLRELSR